MLNVICCVVNCSIVVVIVTTWWTVLFAVVIDVVIIPLVTLYWWLFVTFIGGHCCCLFNYYLPPLPVVGGDYCCYYFINIVVVITIGDCSLGVRTLIPLLLLLVVRRYCWYCCYLVCCYWLLFGGGGELLVCGGDRHFCGVTGSVPYSRQCSVINWRKLLFWRLCIWPSIVWGGLYTHFYLQTYHHPQTPKHAAAAPPLPCVHSQFGAGCSLLTFFWRVLLLFQTMTWHVTFCVLMVTSYYLFGWHSFGRNMCIDWFWTLLTIPGRHACIQAGDSLLTVKTILGRANPKLSNL